MTRDDAIKALWFLISQTHGAIGLPSVEGVGLTRTAIREAEQAIAALQAEAPPPAYEDAINYQPRTVMRYRPRGIPVPATYHVHEDDTEAPPAPPEAMPAIEENDLVSWDYRDKKGRSRVGNAGGSEDYWNIHWPHTVAEIQRNGVTLWRRGSR
jgi:hypothetical protein